MKAAIARIAQTCGGNCTSKPTAATTRQAVDPRTVGRRGAALSTASYLDGSSPADVPKRSIQLLVAARCVHLMVAARVIPRFLEHSSRFSGRSDEPEFQLSRPVKAG